MLAIAALTVSLASRVVRGTFDKVPTVHSLTSKAKIQHRDRDADERAFATADFSLLWVAEPAATVEPAEPVMSRFTTSPSTIVLLLAANSLSVIV